MAHGASLPNGFACCHCLHVHHHIRYKQFILSIERISPEHLCIDVEVTFKFLVGCHPPLTSFGCTAWLCLRIVLHDVHTILGNWGNRHRNSSCIFPELHVRVAPDRNTRWLRPTSSLDHLLLCRRASQQEGLLTCHSPRDHSSDSGVLCAIKLESSFFTCIYCTGIFFHIVDFSIHSS